MHDDAPDATGPAGPADADAPTVRPVDLRDYTRFDRQHAVRVRVFATDVLTLDLHCLEPLQSTDVLLHADTDATYTVIAGTAWVVTDQGEVGLDPLGAVLVPAGVAHGLDNRSADPLIVLAATAPPDVPVADLTEDDAVAQDGHAVRPPYEGRRVGERLRALLRRTAGETDEPDAP